MKVNKYFVLRMAILSTVEQGLLERGLTAEAKPLARRRYEVAMQYVQAKRVLVFD